MPMAPLRKMQAGRLRYEEGRGEYLRGLTGWAGFHARDARATRRCRGADGVQGSGIGEEEVREGEFLAKVIPVGRAGQRVRRGPAQKARGRLTWCEAFVAESLDRARRLRKREQAPALQSREGRGARAGWRCGIGDWRLRIEGWGEMP